jgi:hypothetical protein
MQKYLLEQYPGVGVFFLIHIRSPVSGCLRKTQPNKLSTHPAVYILSCHPFFMYEAEIEVTDADFEFAKPPLKKVPSPSVRKVSA